MLSQLLPLQLRIGLATAWPRVCLVFALASAATIGLRLIHQRCVVLKLPPCMCCSECFAPLLLFLFLVVVAVVALAIVAVIVSC